MMAAALRRGRFFYFASYA